MNPPADDSTWWIFAKSKRGNQAPKPMPIPQIAAVIRTMVPNESQLTNRSAPSRWFDATIRKIDTASIGASENRNLPHNMAPVDSGAERKTQKHFPSALTDGKVKRSPRLANT